MAKLALAATLAFVMLSGCQKNQKLGTVGVDLYIHPESATAEDVMLQTAIRLKLEADPLVGGSVHARVVDRLVVLTGIVSKREAATKAEQIARSTRVIIDGDPAIAAIQVSNLIKVGT